MVWQVTLYGGMPLKSMKTDGTHGQAMHYNVYMGYEWSGAFPLITYHL